MVRRLPQLLGGSSYWHSTPTLGTQFNAGKLDGYCRDYSGKVNWVGEINPEGLPLVKRSDGSTYVLPTIAIQKALGHWDHYVASRDEGSLRDVVATANWLMETLDEHGGWKHWPLVGRKKATPYSAMTQGQAASVLCRAASVTGADAYADAARRGLRLMLKEVKDGGTSQIGPIGIILEESPQVEPNAILNGWVYALFGLYDYTLLRPGDTEIEDALRRTLDAFTQCVWRYDTGYWSLYNLTGDIASPYYHRAHIAQLTAMEMAFPGDVADAIRPTREAFESHLASGWKRTNAILRKTKQKIVRPTPIQPST
jgi:hypothetical protein